MKDQIKIQVSDDGLFGTPVNPYENTFTGGSYNAGNSTEYWDFQKAHPQLPLTTPQIPKSAVMGEMVWQRGYYLGHKGNWKTCGDKAEYKMAAFIGLKTRQAYNIITPVPNSEPIARIRGDGDYVISEHSYDGGKTWLYINKMTKEEAGKLRGKFVGNEPKPFTNIAVSKNVTQEGNNYSYSEPKETVEEAAEKYLQKYKYMGGSVIKPAFIDGANWQAQQQPVLKSEGNNHPILDNTLFIDNASEALYEVIGEGGSEFNMLVCEAKDKDGNFYQLHIRAIRMDHADHISNDEEMPMYGVDEQYRLIELPQPPVKL